MLLVLPEQMREMDRKTIEEIGLQGIVLMERAAMGAVDTLIEHFEDYPMRRIGIVCGGGNNGGDGLAMARMLTQRGYEVSIGLMSAPANYDGDAARNLNICKRLNLEIHDLSETTKDDLHQALGYLGECDVWCDALLGTGLDRPVEGKYAAVIEFLNEQDAVFSVDVPSGLHSGTGEVLGRCVRADVTATFGLAKLGQAVYPGRDRCGDIYVVDIGIPESVIDEVGAEARLLMATTIRLPDRHPTFHKGDAGRICLVGGNVGKTGAILMAARGALCSGAGLLTVGTADAVVSDIAPAVHELMSAAVLSDQPDDDHLKRLSELIEDMDVVAIGPGLGTSAGSRAALDHVLENFPGDLVLDADALNLLSQRQDYSVLRGDPERPRFVLTPHPGEMARLRDCSVGDILAGPIRHTRELAEETTAIVVLKMASTIIAHPNGDLAINSSGNPGMATGGMGDALTGIIAAQLCEKIETYEGVCNAVFVHGMAGDLAGEKAGERGLSVSALLEAVPHVWNFLESR